MSLVCVGKGKCITYRFKELTASPKKIEKEIRKKNPESIDKEKAKCGSRARKENEK